MAMYPVVTNLGLVAVSKVASLTWLGLASLLSVQLQVRGQGLYTLDLNEKAGEAIYVVTFQVNFLAAKKQLEKSKCLYVCPSVCLHQNCKSPFVTLSSNFIFQVVYACVMFPPCTFLLYTCTISIAVKPVLAICVYLYSHLQ